MAKYPNSIYTPRARDNRAGVAYDPTKRTVIFAEDFKKGDDEIIAIQNELGTNPRGVFATVRAWLEDLTSKSLRPFNHFLRAGRYHVHPIGTTTTLTLTANFLHAVPLFFPVDHAITRIAIHVTTAVAGSVRLGIYRDSNIYPSSLFLDIGTVTTEVTGVREIAGLNIRLERDVLYWLVAVANAGPAVSAITGATAWAPLGLPTTTLNQNSSGLWRVSFTFGPLPATFPAGAVAEIINVPKIAVFF